MGKKRVIVVGAGAAGLMAAGRAAALGCEVVLLEKNQEIGKKIMVSGKGRCNLTNAGDIRDFVERYPGGGKFLYTAFHHFDNMDLVDFFFRYGVETKVERGGRIFPVSDEAGQIVRALRRFAMEEGGVKLEVDKRVVGLHLEKKRLRGVMVAGEREPRLGEAVIIATGGASFPGTGSTGDGYQFGEQAGHKVIPPLPALVPLRTAEAWPGRLQGLSLRNVRASLWLDGRKAAEEFGEMLFTHFGLSGPIILTLSRAAVHGLTGGKKAEIRLNLKPALTPEQLEQRLQRDFEKYRQKQLKNALADLLPKRLIPVMVELSGISPEKKVLEIERRERLRFVSLLQSLPLQVSSHLGLGAAIITSGGIDVKEVEPATMASKLVQGLYWAGEVLDVDGVTGGYNLQAAFSTGRQAGEAAAYALSH